MEAASRPSSRRYDSPRRRLQSEQTRGAVLDAAGRLFADRGWAGTGMREVAAAAGVSVETVYAGFGSKPELLKAVFDVAVVGDDAPVALAERPAVVAMREGPRTCRVAQAASVASGISARTCELLQALIAGAGSDETLTGLLADLDERRRRQIADLYAVVAGRPATALQLDEVWLLTSADVFHLLVHRLGWSAEQHEAWLGASLLRIVRQPHTQPEPTATEVP